MNTLELAREHLAAANALPVPVGDLGRWQDVLAPMRHSIPLFTTVEQAIHYAQRDIPFTHREPCLPMRVVNTWIELLEEEFRHFGDHIGRTGDDPRSIKDTLYWSENYKAYTSNIHLWHLRSLFFCLSYLDKPKRILEIGGGHGAMARIWCINSIAPCERYTIIDIAESLFFSEVFLRDIFGDDVGYYIDSDPETKITLVPLQRLEDYKRASDLVINIGSMQEMSDPWVVYYSKWLDRHDTRWFYSLNYAGDPITDMRESRTFWAPIMSAKWDCRVINSDPPMVKAMCTRRNFAEHLYEKGDKWGFDPPMWSRQTYLKELNSVRQFLDRPEALVNIVRDIVERPYMGNLPRVPKEVMALLTIAEGQGSKEAKDLKKKIEGLIGGFMP